MRCCDLLRLTADPAARIQHSPQPLHHCGPLSLPLTCLAVSNMSAGSCTLAAAAAASTWGDKENMQGVHMGQLK